MRLEEIAYVASGSTPPKDCFAEEGIPYLKMYNLRNQKIDFEYKPQYILESVHIEKLSRSRAKSGDLIMNIVGPPLGKLAIVPESLPECNFNQAAVMIRPYSERVTLNCFLFYYLSEMSEIESIATKGTAGQANISLTQSQLMRIPLPPLSEIQRINESVENLFRLIHTIQESNDSLINAIINLKSKILDLAMQGKLVPQDPTDEPAADMLRRINPKAKIITDNPHYPNKTYPESWCLASIEDINSYKSETINPSNSPNISFDVYSVPSYSTGKPEKLKGKDIGSTKQSIRKGDILLCKINPHLNRVWLIEESYEIPQIASSEWIVIRSNNLYIPFLKFYLESPEFRKLICSQVSGVGGSLTRAQPATVKKYHVPIPPYREQQSIVKMIDEIFSILDNIRDSLQN